MSITPIGAFVILFSILLLVIQPRGLFWLAVFFVPFSATAVINIGSAQPISIQATMFCGGLWLAYQAINFIYYGRIKTHRLYLPVLIAMFVFGGVALFSLVMPIVIDGRVLVPSGEQMRELLTQIPLALSRRQFTQWGYLMYGIVFAAAVAQQACTYERFIKTLKVLMISGLFVSLWGILQAAISMAGLPYPSAIFNTATNESAQGYTQFLDTIGISRVCSVAVEPSILAQNLVAFLPIILLPMVAGKPIISRRVDLITFLAATLCLLLSTSSTAYFGLVGILLITMYLLYKAGKLKLKYLVYGMGAIVVVLVGCLVVPSANMVIQSMVIGKNESYSALERAAAAMMGWDFFTQYPLLGIGWGVLPPSSLLTYIPGHTGLMGMIAFCAPIIMAWRRLSACGTRRALTADHRNILAVGVLGSLLALIFVCILSGFTFYFSHFWIIFGLAMAAPAALRDRLSLEGKSS